MLVYVGSIAGNNALASASEWTVPEGATVNLIGNPSGYTYSWLPAEMVANPSAQNTTAVVENTTVFTLLVSDGICTKQDTVQVKTVAFICGEPYIYVPNAFSPNGDQENDVLFVRGLLIEGMVFRVFNRWGELVFESFDRTIGWDGTFKGKLVEPDVYDYYLKALCIDGNESIIKGNVTVLR
jgi:gliding motility-associated-like protein